MKYRNRRFLNTSFEADLLDEFTKQCQKEGKPRNQIITQLIEGYLKKNNDIDQQPRIDLFLHNPEIVIIPRVDASDGEWTTYWKTCNSNESGRLEGLFNKRAREAKNRFYEHKRETIITKTVNNNK